MKEPLFFIIIPEKKITAILRETGKNLSGKVSYCKGERTAESITSHIFPVIFPFRTSGANCHELQIPDSVQKKQQGKKIYPQSEQQKSNSIIIPGQAGCKERKKRIRGEYQSFPQREISFCSPGERKKIPLPKEGGEGKFNFYRIFRKISPIPETLLHSSGNYRKGGNLFPYIPH